MSKFLVETYYTCTFKIVHELSELNEKQLSDIDNRKDGKVEIIDVTVNNRKTKRSSGKTEAKKSDIDVKISHSGMNSDIHASANYRANMVKVFAKKAVEAC